MVVSGAASVVRRVRVVAGTWADPPARRDYVVLATAGAALATTTTTKSTSTVPCGL